MRGKRLVPHLLVPTLHGIVDVTPTGNRHLDTACVVNTSFATSTQFHGEHDVTPAGNRHLDTAR